MSKKRTSQIRFVFTLSPDNVGMRKLYDELIRIEDDARDKVLAQNRTRMHLLEILHSYCQRGSSSVSYPTLTFDAKPVAGGVDAVETLSSMPHQASLQLDPPSSHAITPAANFSGLVGRDAFKPE